MRYAVEIDVKLVLTDVIAEDEDEARGIASNHVEEMLGFRPMVEDTKAYTIGQGQSIAENQAESPGNRQRSTEGGRVNIECDDCYDTGVYVAIDENGEDIVVTCGCPAGRRLCGCPHKKRYCYACATNKVIEQRREALKALADHEKQYYPADDGRTYSEAEPDEP